MLALASATCGAAADSYQLLHTLPRGTGFVNSLALRPDGRVLAIATDDGSVKLWDVETGAPLQTLAGDGGAVYTVAFSPDGRMLATGSLDAAVRFFDLETGREARILTGHAGWINALTFAADGRRLFSAGRDSTVRIWDVGSGRNTRTLDDYTSEVFTVAASPDGRWLASDKGDTFCVRDRNTGSQISAGIPAQWGINALAFSPSGDVLMTGGYDGKLWIWNLRERRLERSVAIEGGPVISLAIRPDGLLAALLCSGDRTVKLIDTRSWTEAGRLPGVAYPAGSVAFSGDGSLVAAGGGDSPVRLWRRQAALAAPAPTRTAAPEHVAPTPVMGWSSWNYYTCKVNDAIVRASADALVSNGMAAAGYRYVIVDDCWEGERDSAGVIHTNSKFPDMKALSDYVHAKGLKFGIYSSPGPKTCAGFEGSQGHEEQDAATYGEWGIDWLKYDLCTFRGDAAAQVAAFKKMHDALVKTGRPMVYALCQYGNDRVWTWGASAGGNQWRTSRDITDSYDRMAMNGFGENGLESFAGPGHWNDPDMLEIGNGKMSHDEYVTHMTLWSMLAAPLLAGTDVIHIKPETLAILTNPEVIAVDQDALGKQGYRVSQQGPLEVWVKPLTGGRRAVALFNRGENAMPVTADFKALGIGGSASVRDLWARQDLGSSSASYTATVAAHGAVLLRLEESGKKD